MSKSAAADAAINADQLEADVWATGPRPLDDALADDLVAEDNLNERYGSPGDPELADWAQTDTAKETAVTEIREEIERRQSILGALYPFDLVGSTLSYRPGACRTAVYEFCLAIATTGHSLSENPHASVPREFERLVGRLLRSYAGAGAVFYRLGWPPDGDRPSRLIDALVELRSHTSGEFLFNNTPENDARSQQGDDGIDIVVWRPIGDGRPGKLVFLGQCACGNDWPNKLKELDPHGFNLNWCGHISRAGQLRCMAIPRHVPHDEVWGDSVHAAGILLDRCRLTWLAERLLPEQEMTEVQSRLVGLIEILRAAPAPAASEEPERASGDPTGIASSAPVKKGKPGRRRR